MEKEVLNKDKMLWKEDCAYMSVMGNRHTCRFEGVNGIFEWIAKSSQFYKSDDVYVQTTAYSVIIRNAST